MTTIEQGLFGSAKIRCLHQDLVGIVGRDGENRNGRGRQWSRYRCEYDETHRFLLKRRYRPGQNSRRTASNAAG